MNKVYPIRKNGQKGALGIEWTAPNPDHAGKGYYGPGQRYVVMGHMDKQCKQYFRNPLLKPLLTNGRK